MAAEVVALGCSSFLFSGPAVLCRARQPPRTRMGRIADWKAFNFHSTFALGVSFFADGPVGISMSCHNIPLGAPVRGTTANEFDPPFAVLSPTMCLGSMFVAE